MNLRVGVTVMPEWFQCEGIESVLDRLVTSGVTEIATSPYLAEVASPGEGAREPPSDGNAGLIRPLDRSLWGRTETWIRTSPSFVHDLRRYEGLRYQPSPPSNLTAAHPRLIDDVIHQASKRGIAVYLQVMAASPPGYRVQFSGAVEEDQCLGPDGRLHQGRVDRNASIASPHVADYCAHLLSELALRYPGAIGFRIDWPEYPPYDLRSALFDFSTHARPLIGHQGVNPAQLSRQILNALTNWQVASMAAAAGGPASVLDALKSAGWNEFFSDRGLGNPLWVSKRRAVMQLLQRCRAALDEVPGPRRLFEPQIFPPPFSLVSGFPLDRLEGLADAVGVKLYTMHWPMIARSWAQQLVGKASPEKIDAVTGAMAQFFRFCDVSPTNGATIHYPEPNVAHPVGAVAQHRKIVEAQRTAGKVPVIAFAHSYGPLQDVIERVGIAASAAMSQGGSGRVWINRYGYMSDFKLTRLSALTSSKL